MGKGKERKTEEIQRCPRCKLRELLEREVDPEYTANDYLNIFRYESFDPNNDHNRICRACGLTFKVEDKAQEVKGGRRRKRS